MKVTAAAGSSTTAAGMFFLSNGCYCVAMRGSSSGGAGVFPCLQHGKPAAHLQIKGVEAAAVRLACLLIPSAPTTSPTHLVQLALESWNHVLRDRVGQMLQALVDRGDAAMVLISSLLVVAAAAAVGNVSHRGAAVGRGQVREGGHHALACVAVCVVWVLIGNEIQCVSRWGIPTTSGKMGKSTATHADL